MKDAKPPPGWFAQISGLADQRLGLPSPTDRLRFLQQDVAQGPRQDAVWP